MSIAVLVLGAAALAAQEPPAPTSSPPARSSASANLIVQVEVLPSGTAAFSREAKATAAGARVDAGQIVVQAAQPGDLLVEVWKQLESGAARAERRQLVARAPVRLRANSTGRISSPVPMTVSRALEAAAARPDTYTVVVVY